MTTDLPETLDGLVLSTADQADELLQSLRHLDEFLSSHFRGDTTRHRFTDPQTREDVEHMVQSVCQAMGLVEGACRALDGARQLRARCQDED